MQNNTLQGCSVVITRPAAQAQGLADLIGASGGHTVLFPVLKITDAVDKSALDKLIQEIAQYSILIFISPNAVKYGLAYLLKHTQIPSSCRIAAVGKGTARAANDLLQHDIDIVPAAFDGQSGGYNTESLLKLPELVSVKDQRIAIIRGNGGRELLASTLRERGAKVSYICSYTRSIPDDNKLAQRLKTLNSERDNVKQLCVTVTSGESLTNFVSLLASNANSWLNNVQLIVINARLVTIAKKLGFKIEPLIAYNASDLAIAECVINWYKN